MTTNHAAMCAIRTPYSTTLSAKVRNVSHLSGLPCANSLEPIKPAHTALDEVAVLTSSSRKPPTSAQLLKALHKSKLAHMSKTAIQILINQLIADEYLIEEYDVQKLRMFATASAHLLVATTSEGSKPTIPDQYLVRVPPKP